MRSGSEERPRATPDLFTFEFWSPQATFGGHVAIWRWPAERVAWYATAVFREGRPVVALADEFPLGATLELRGSGLWADHNLEDPYVHWSIGLEAFALELDDPTDERGERVPLGYELDWDLDAVAIADLDDGYEQPARVHGEILLGTEAYELNGYGWRAHRGIAPAATGPRRHGLADATVMWTRPDRADPPDTELVGWSQAATRGGTMRTELWRYGGGGHARAAGFDETWQPAQ